MLEVKKKKVSLIFCVCELVHKSDTIPKNFIIEVNSKFQQLTIFLKSARTARLKFIICYCKGLVVKFVNLFEWSKCISHTKRKQRSLLEICKEYQSCVFSAASKIILILLKIHHPFPTKFYNSF